MSGPTYVRITADVTDLTAKLALAKAEFANSNSELRSMAQQMNAAGKSASAELKAGLTQAAQAAAQARTEVNALNREIRETSEATHSGGLKDIISFGESGIHIRFREMAEAVTGLGIAIGAAFAGKEILEGIEHTAELGANLLKLSEQTGVAVETLSGWHYGAEQNDVSAESLDTAIKKLGKSMQEALTTPTSNAALAFHAMGISQEYLKEHSNDLQAVLMKMADAFHEHADGARADAVAQDVLGRSGADAIPWLRQGSAAIQEQIEKQKELGSQITGPTAEAMKEHLQAVKDMKEVWQGVWIGLSSTVIPFLTNVARGIMVIANAVKDSTAGIRAFAEALGLLNGTPAQNWEKAEQAPGGHAFHMGGEEKKPEFPNLEKAAKPPKDFYAQWKEQLDQQLLALQLFGDQAKAYELKFWQEKLVVATDGGKNYTNARRSITSEVYNLENEAYRKSIEDAKRAEEEKKRATNEEYSRFKATIDAQKEAARLNIANAKDAIAEELRLDQQLVDEAKRLYGVDSKNFEEAQRRKTADMRAQVEAQMEPYKKLVSTIGNSFDQMFNGLLEGTTSFREAMRRLTLGIIEDFARMAIQSVEKWALAKIREVIITEQTETQKTAAVAAGEAATTGIKTAAAAEGKAAEAVAGSASVFGDANKAAAGAYAAVAGIPIIGPILAPVAAATAFVGVMAFDVFSAAGGMDIGPGVNPMVQLHEKEMVLPANLAEGVRNMSDGGGRQPFELHYHDHGGGGSGRSKASDLVDAINHQVRIGRLKLA